MLSIFKKLVSPPTCRGCKYLYSEGVGYADDDRTATRISCALDQQPALPVTVAVEDSVQDQAAILNGCQQHCAGPHISLDVLGSEGAGLFSSDAEQVDAITRHSGRPVEGQPKSWALASLMRAGTSRVSFGKTRRHV